MYICMSFQLADNVSSEVEHSTLSLDVNRTGEVQYSKVSDTATGNKSNYITQVV